MKPLAIDLYCGLGGWTEGLLAEGWDVVGFDIERHAYGEHCYPAQLVVQDVETLHGRQFANARLIVASPPCQKYSYMLMPWSKARALANWYLADPARVVELNRLFDACFRIQREASAAAGELIPLIVENVRGAQRWVGRSRWNYGSYHLWGDVPALMPSGKVMKNAGGSWFRQIRGHEIDVRHNPDGRPTPHMTNPAEHGVKRPGLDWNNYRNKGEGSPWWAAGGPAALLPKSQTRKEAAAQIAKIPAPLAGYIGRVFYPREVAA